MSTLTSIIAFTLFSCVKNGMLTRQFSICPTCPLLMVKIKSNNIIVLMIFYYVPHFLIWILMTDRSVEIFICFTIDGNHFASFFAVRNLPWTEFCKKKTKKWFDHYSTETILLHFSLYGICLGQSFVFKKQKNYLIIICHFRFSVSLKP